MASRENLEFETTIKSDCAPLNKIVQKLIEEKIEIHCLRDLTRGGLSSALNEIASQAKIEIEIEENSIKVLEEVKGVCEILGFDPLYVANEGRFIAFVKKEDAERALNIMHSDEVSNNATIIGEVKSKRQNGLVTIKSIIGATRILDMLSGEQLPRIC
jgi:hydrogenase expression/formation protein HypE